MLGSSTNWGEVPGLTWVTGTLRTGSGAISGRSHAGLAGICLRIIPMEPRIRSGLEGRIPPRHASGVLRLWHPFTMGRQLHWWYPIIAELRKSYVVARRRYTRQRRMRRRDRPMEEFLYEIYRDAKKTLQIAISRSKTSAREELIKTLNLDLLGRPYQTVTGKLRQWTAPLIQSLKPQPLHDVISVLLPSREEHTPQVMALPVLNSDITEKTLRVADG